MTTPDHDTSSEDQLEALLSGLETRLGDRVERDVKEVGSAVAHMIGEDLQQLRRSLLNTLTEHLRAESNALYSQVDGLLRLRDSVDLSVPWPRLGGWALGPDAAMEVVDLIRGRQRQTVLELGSGSSTLIFASVLAETGGTIVSLDHEPAYAARTRARIAEAGLESVATVVDAPLVPHSISGGEFQWYDITGLPQRTFDLLVVDGPPASTGTGARYPAVPVLASRLTSDAVIVLDDADRPDESSVLRAWSDITTDHELVRIDHAGGLALLLPRVEDE